MSNKEISIFREAANLEQRLGFLKKLVARWTEEGDSPDNVVPGLFFFRREAPSEPETVMYQPSICILAQGAKRVYSGTGSFVYDSHRFLAASVDIPTVVEVISASPQRPCLGIVLTIDRQEVSQLMLDGKLPSPRAQQTGLGIAASEITPHLLDAVFRLVSLLDEPRDIPVLAPVIRREILYRLLVGDQGLRLRQIATAGSRSHQISQAIDWLKENFVQPLKVDDLAARVNMSTSTFHHHFRALTARSPLQYQKWLRLNEARRLMLVERADAATASFEVGYESPSQFSREYSRLFGASPTRDVTNLRRQAGAGPN